MSSSGYFEQTRPDVVGLVPATAMSILDVGCGAGAVGAQLRTAGRRITGLEFDEVSAATAGQRLDAAFRMNLNDLDALREFARAHEVAFDCVIAADVLEHLVDPWSVLAVLMTMLHPGGTVVVSLPNIRVLSVVGPLLLRGQFRYRDRGVLDRTHLRFFTREGALELVTGAGATVRSIDRAPAPWRTGWKARVGRAVGDLGNEQFLLVGTRDL